MLKADIKSMTLPQLTAELKNLGQPAYKAKQVFAWLQKRGVFDFEEMTDISKDFRSKLIENFDIFGCTIEKKLVSEYDNTVKYLFKLHDGEFVESVLMQYKYGYTLCVSTQVGCKMGCSFCASAIGGFTRNLTASEMLSQIHTAQKDRNIRISHIVLMGMGEPLDNFDNTIRFLQLVTDANGLNLSMRHISLSTSGIVPRIYDLLEYNFQLTLSISLHAPNNEIRSNIMPINSKWDVDELLKACRKYSKVTSRRISFEYAMIKGINDSDECAQELALKLKGIICHVNLIPVNEVQEKGHVRSTQQRLERFSEILEKKGIAVTIRRTLGADINASCGQLRRTHNSQRGENLEDCCEN